MQFHSCSPWFSLFFLLFCPFCFVVFYTIYYHGSRHENNAPMCQLNCMNLPGFFQRVILLSENTLLVVKNNEFCFNPFARTSLFGFDLNGVQNLTEWPWEGGCMMCAFAVDRNALIRITAATTLKEQRKILSVRCPGKSYQDCLSSLTALWQAP